MLLGVTNILGKKYDNVLGFGIPDLLLNFLSCQGFLENNGYVVILKFPNRMFEYYFNKGFIIFDCDENKLKSLPSEVRDRVGEDATTNSDKVMICSTNIPSTSNTLKNFLVNSNSHSSYTNQEFNDKKNKLSPSLVHMLHHKSRKSTIQSCFKNRNLILML